MRRRVEKERLRKEVKGSRLTVNGRVSVYVLVSLRIFVKVVVVWFRFAAAGDCVSDVCSCLFFRPDCFS